MRVLIPLPSADFDPTESSVPWAALRRASIDVTFATPDGNPGAADDRMLSGRGLGPWKPVLRADALARRRYDEMVGSSEFNAPMSFSTLDNDADGLLLPGGHAAGMKPYLESEPLQRLAIDYLDSGRPVAAICHGVLVLARARRNDGSSAIAGRKLTALTRSMEMTAYGMTALWLGNYYRTYRETVQAEVERALTDTGRFEEGPFAVLRDNEQNLDRGFTVVDGNLVTARWPGDAHRFAADFITLLHGAEQ